MMQCAAVSIQPSPRCVPPQKCVQFASASCNETANGNMPRLRTRSPRTIASVGGRNSGVKLSTSTESTTYGAISVRNVTRTSLRFFCPRTIRTISKHTQRRRQFDQRAGKANAHTTARSSLTNGLFIDKWLYLKRF